MKLILVIAATSGNDSISLIIFSYMRVNSGFHSKVLAFLTDMNDMKFGLMTT